MMIKSRVTGHCIIDGYNLDRNVRIIEFYQNASSNSIGVTHLTIPNLKSKMATLLISIYKSSIRFISTVTCSTYHVILIVSNWYCYKCWQKKKKWHF